MDEDILVPLIVFSFAALIVKMAIDYAKWKRMNVKNDSEQSMTTSELKHLIEDAVQDANAPLIARIQALESATKQEPLLIDRELAEEEPVKSIGRARTR